MSDYIRPGTLREALQARAERPTYTILAGGTDLFVNAGVNAEPAGVIDIFGLTGLSEIELTDDGRVIIGAAVPYRELLASELISSKLPCLHAAVREIGALQIQSRGTIGGNIGTSSPVGDTLPVLLALDAQIALASTHGTRTVPYEQFCTGYRTIDLASDELITHVVFPPRAHDLIQQWRKVGTRRAQSISKVMFAGSARVKAGKIAHIRLALGAVADRPIRATACEDVVLERRPDARTIELAREALDREIKPIDDLRSTAAYRLAVAKNIVSRFIASLDDHS